MTKASQNVEEKAAARGKLRQAQHVVLELIAQFVKPSEIAKALTAQGLADIVTKAWIEKCSSERCRPKWARAHVEKYREQFLTQLSRIPCRHRAYRLARLQQVIEGTDDDRIRIKALTAAHQMSGDDVQRIEEIGPSLWNDLANAFERVDSGGQRDGD